MKDNIKTIELLKKNICRNNANPYRNYEISDEMRNSAVEKLFELEFKMKKNKANRENNDKVFIKIKGSDFNLKNTLSHINLFSIQKQSERKLNPCEFESTARSLNNSLSKVTTDHQFDSNSNLKNKILNEKFNLIPNVLININDKHLDSTVSNKKTHSKNNYDDIKIDLNNTNKLFFSHQNKTKEQVTVNSNKKTFDKFYHKLMQNLNLNEKQIFSEKYKEKKANK